MVDTVSVAIYDVYRDTLHYKALDARQGSVFQSIRFPARSFECQRYLKKGIAKLVEKSLGVEEDITAEAMEVRLGELLNSGLLTRLVGMQIDKFFNGIKTGICLLFFLILLIPATGVAIALYLNKKNCRKSSTGKLIIKHKKRLFLSI